MTPVMAELPTERHHASTAFANVGVDYFGPFTVTIGRRNEKRWCCLFTCLTVRAVHIKIIPKLDTDSCLNAIIRFIARRGKPIKMISDNGTNFFGADREFKCMSQLGTKKELKNIWFNKESDGSSIRLPHLTLEEYGKDWSETARKQCTQCWGTDQLRKMFFQQQCVLLRRR